jgi:transcription antitermination factor NusG
MNWVAIKTAPTARCEFTVLHRITQAEYPALLPFETVWQRMPGKKKPVERKQALFPRYVFAGLVSVAEDYSYLKSKIPEVQGIVSRTPGIWSPYILSESDVQLIRDRVAQSAEMTEVDLHKSLRVGKRIHVEIGGQTQETTIDEVTRKGVRALLKILGDMPISVEVPFDKVRAA